MIELLVVGPIATNCWIYTWDVPPEKTGECAVIDPGADPEAIISRLERPGGGLQGQPSGYCNTPGR